MTEAEIIEAGVTALSHIREGERMSFQHWCAVGRACQIGRREAMAAARVNTPKGSVYAMRMRDWLNGHGFAHIDRQDQFWAMLMADNAASISTWLDALPTAKRARFSTPHGIINGWQKRHRGAAPRAGQSASHNKGRPVTKPTGAPIRWPQDMIKRAAQAMAEARTNDRFILARVMLDAAIRTTGDLLDLLPPEPAPKHPTKATSQPEMAV